MDYVSEIRKKIGHDKLIMVGAATIIYRDGKILLQMRKDNGCWAIHGGGVEMGEIVEEAAKRELREETGLIANNLELFGIYSGEDRFFTYPNGDVVYLIGVIYICRDFSGNLVLETNETSDLKWFDINDLPESIHPPNKRLLGDFVNYIDKNNTFLPIAPIIRERN